MSRRAAPKANSAAALQGGGICFIRRTAPKANSAAACKAEALA